MTGEYMESCMVEIARKKRDALCHKYSELSPGEKTAAKAYQISMSIIDQAAKLVTMKFSDKAYDEKYYSVREQRVFNNPKSMYFIDCKDWFYREQDAVTKEAFLVYAHGVQMARSVFLDTKKAELAIAEQSNAVEKVFECSMLIGTLTDLLEQWDKLWKAGEGAARERL